MSEDYEIPFEIRPNSVEEDRYNLMKGAYKRGKAAWPDLHSYELTRHPDMVQQFMNGWHYQQWVATQCS